MTLTEVLVPTLVTATVDGAETTAVEYVVAAPQSSSDVFSSAQVVKLVSTATAEASTTSSADASDKTEPCSDKTTSSAVSSEISSSAHSRSRRPASSRSTRATISFASATPSSASHHGSSHVPQASAVNSASAALPTPTASATDDGPLFTGGASVVKLISLTTHELMSETITAGALEPLSTAIVVDVVNTSRCAAIQAKGGRDEGCQPGPGFISVT